MEKSVMLTSHPVTIGKPLIMMKKISKIALEIGDRAGEGGAYGNFGIAQQSLGEYRKAIEYH